LVITRHLNRQLEQEVALDMVVMLPLRQPVIQIQEVAVAGMVGEQIPVATHMLVEAVAHRILVHYKALELILALIQVMVKLLFPGKLKCYEESNRCA
jgi:hypothetical protein